MSERPFKVSMQFVLALVLYAATASAQGEPHAPPSPEPDGSRETPPRADLNPAEELVRAGDLVAAEGLLAGLAPQFPDDSRLLLLYGEVLLAQGQAAKALPLLEHAVDLDPTRPRANFQLAQARQSKGDAAGALVAYAKEIEVNENAQVRVMARLNRMVLLREQKRWDEAAVELEALVALPGEDVQKFVDPATLYGELASVYMDAGELDAAGQSLERGLTHGFHSATHYLSLAARYAARSLHERALPSYQHALELDPSLADAERGLAAALDRLGRGAEALPHLKRYVELQPQAADAAQARERIRQLEKH